MNKKFYQALPVADPGFPRGEGANPGGGGNIQFCQFFSKTAWNWKNLNPGESSLSRPLRSATAFFVMNNFFRDKIIQPSSCWCIWIISLFLNLQRNNENFYCFINNCFYLLFFHSYRFYSIYFIRCRGKHFLVFMASLKKKEFNSFNTIFHLQNCLTHTL